MKNNYYPLFCVASRILMHEQPYVDLDIVWQRAHELYLDFLDSKYNNYSTSELDCINAYMDLVYSNTPAPIIVDVARSDDGEFDIEGMTNEFNHKLKRLCDTKK